MQNNFGKKGNAYMPDFLLKKQTDIKILILGISYVVAVKLFNIAAV